MQRLIYQGSPDEENRARLLLEKASAAIAERVGSRGLDAIVLAGGFGRGEGALLREDGPDGVPFNDVDLLLVGSRPRVSASVLGELRHSLARLLRVDFVDINYMRSSELKRVSPTVFFYELKHGNRIVWGAQDALGTLPSFDPAELPTTEATRLFLNRGLGLLSVLLQLETGEKGELVARRSAVAWSKIVLAAGDSLLLERRLYHWSYVERARRMREVARYSGLEPGFFDAYEKAVAFKLTADFSLLSSREPAALCSEAVRIHERHFQMAERQRTFAELADWSQYPSVVLRVGLQPFRRRLKHYLTGYGVAARVRGLAQFVRLPLWDEERRLALLPLVLYAVRQTRGQTRRDGCLAEACAIQYGRREVREGDWKRLAADLVGESHP
ncbi:MAG: hypothetical protein JSW03_03550 [Candidatus Eiseniibacteriota bacterium]|nr:MAG: hypothetical protein JSW03_03550 [Candidatus Eisenbacteria bacterium]